MAARRAVYRRFSRSLLTVLALSAAAFSPLAGASAQEAGLEPRVKKLEAEMRAVQRKVFPGGPERFFEPELTAKPAETPAQGVAATPALSDLLLRVDALESQLTRLTALAEENQYKIGQAETRLAALEAKAEAAAAMPPAGSSGAAAMGAAGAAAAAAAAPSPERIAAVSAIVKPESGDAGEDEYLYGYRLWEAKFYPEAQTQLKKMVDQYPKHKRISFARNLLGRAYLDDGKYASAADALFGNYQKDPKGERAPDSLYFLSEALVKLGKKAEACTALTELAEVYPDVAAGRMADRVAAGRRNAGCK